MELLFDEAAGESNNKFHKGLNVTVRLGTKYATARLGSHVTFKNLQGEYLGEGDLTLDGLRRVLETVYGKVILDDDNDFFRIVV